MERTVRAPAVRGMRPARCVAACPPPVLVHAFIALLVASTLDAAAASVQLFGTDAPGGHRPPVDDDVHAAASSAARWHKKMHRIFDGGAAGDGRLLGRALFGGTVPGISHLLQADVAEAASRGRATKQPQAARLPCLRDDGTVIGSAGAGCQPASRNSKTALLAHHMYQQRDDEKSAATWDLPLADNSQKQHQVQETQNPQRLGGSRQAQHDTGDITGSQLKQRQPGDGAEPGGTAGSGAGAAGDWLAGGRGRLVTAAGAAAEMQPLAVHSRIVDRALDDHLEHLGSDNGGDAIAAIPLPVDGPGSMLRGWEAADEGGALGLGFQHIAADAFGQAQGPGRHWSIISGALQLLAVVACAAIITGFVARHRGMLAQRDATRYGDGKRLPLLSTPQPIIGCRASADDVTQPLTPESAGCRPRRLEADLDLTSPLPASPISAPCFDLTACRAPEGDKPRSGRTIHLHAFAGGLTVAPPQLPFSPQASSAPCSGPSPLFCSPLSLASPTPSPGSGASKKHVRWELPSPEWTALSPGGPTSGHAFPPQ